MAVFRKSSPRKTETKIVPDAQDGTLPYVEFAAGEHTTEGDNAADGEPGQLAADVFQTADEIVVVAPVAGVFASDLAISITDGVLEIKGRRSFQFSVSPQDYFTQECFWGNFSRSIILPDVVDAGRVNASFKNGVLVIRVPKVEKIKTRMVKILEE